jgi:hypothetical protein
MRPAHDRVPPLLRRAHRMMAQGEFENAAFAFHDLAQKAENRFPQRAPFLYFEAGRAAVFAGETAKGIAFFRSGLTLLGTQQRYERLETAGARIVQELRDRGLNAGAEEIAGVIRANLPAGVEARRAPSPKRPLLPTHCPSCGAAIKPDEIEWLDAVTAECDYCGSPLRGGG